MSAKNNNPSISSTSQHKIMRFFLVLTGGAINGCDDRMLLDDDDESVLVLLKSIDCCPWECLFMKDGFLGSCDRLVKTSRIYMQKYLGPWR